MWIRKFTHGLPGLRAVQAEHYLEEVVRIPMWQPATLRRADGTVDYR